jgi:glycerophosphoryl diester phosphodiesterase
MGSDLAFDLEAHRGGRALLPENTLPAFANALTMGVDTLELDVGITADGEVIVSHERGLNPDLARDRSGGYIAAPGTPFIKLRLEDVRTYDVGQIRPDSSYATQFPNQRAMPGTHIPTLRELFALVRKSGNTRVRFNIETKIDPNHPDETLDPQAFVARLLGLIEAEGFSDRVMIQSFDWRTLRLVQQQAPKIPTAYLTLQRGSAPTIALDKATSWTAGFSPADHGGSLPRTIKAAGGAIWSPYFGDVTEKLVTEAHDLELRVVVWTVNKPDDMARMIGLGVDGIISDRPDLLRQVAGEKGIALPAGTPVVP